MLRAFSRVLLATALLVSVQPAGFLAPLRAAAALPGSYYPIAAWPDGAGAFASPVGLAVDSGGNIYVADTDNHRIKKLSSAGEVILLLGSRGTGQGQFRYPEGVAVDSTGRIFVSDTGNHRVQVFDASGGYLSTIGGPGTGTGQFQTPTGLAVNAAGSIFVSDTGNGRIQKFSSTGVHQLTIGSAGVMNGQLRNARGVAVDAAGFIYAADSNNRRIQKFNSSGGYVTQWGPTAGTGDETISRYQVPVGVAVQGSYVYVADSSGHFIERCSTTGATPVTWGTRGAAAGQFDSPAGVLALASGDIYVADTGNNRVERLSSAGVWIDSWSGRGDGPGELDSPRDVTRGPDGSVYIADTGNDRVQVLDSTGAHVRMVGEAVLAAPGGVALDAGSGTVWVSDSGNHVLRSFDETGGALRVVGSLGAAAGQLSSPGGLDIEATGSVLVADSGNNRIQRFSATGTPLGQWGTAGTGNGQFRKPTDVASAPSGGFYVVDSENNRVQRFDSGGGYLGQWGSWGNGDGQFKVPQGIAVDPADGHVYVTDPGNARIQRFEPGGVHVESFGLSGAALGELNWPVGVEIGDGGIVYVTERDNHRVQLFGYDGTAPSTSHSGVPGGWTTQNPVTVTLTATDVESGVAQTYYRLGDGAPQLYGAPFQVTAQGQTLVRYWSVDRAGNTEAVRSVYVRIDSLPPSGSFVLAGGAAYSTTRTVQADSAFSDATSMRFDTGGGYASWIAYSAAHSLTLAADGTATVNAQYRDAMGNAATSSDSIVVDTVAPVSEVSGVPVGWATEPVTLGFSASDSVSGVSEILVSLNGGSEVARTSLTISAEGTNTVTYRALDRAGNAEETRSVTVWIDTIPPAGSLLLDGGAAYATTTTVGVFSDVSGATEMRFDVGEGPGPWRSFSAEETLTLPGDGPHVVTGYYRDQAGLVHETSATITVDHTAPVTTVDGVPDGWTNHPVTLGFSAVDDFAGVDRILVSLNGGPEVARTSLTISAEGTNTVTYRAIDALGNAEETCSVEVLLDSIPPLGSILVDGGASWTTTTTVEVACDVTGATEMRFGAGSGPDDWQPFSQTATLTLPGEGAYTITGQFRDEAGLTLETSATIMVDYTAPDLSPLLVAMARSWTPRFGTARALVSWGASDSNGVVGYSWVIDRAPDTVPDQVIDGTQSAVRVDGRASGIWYVHVRARDAAGNWSDTRHTAVELRIARAALPTQRDPVLVEMTGRPLVSAPPRPLAPTVAGGQSGAAVSAADFRMNASTGSGEASPANLLSNGGALPVSAALPVPAPWLERHVSAPVVWFERHTP